MYTLNHDHSMRSSIADMCIDVTMLGDHLVNINVQLRQANSTVGRLTGLICTCA